MVTRNFLPMRACACILAFDGTLNVGLTTKAASLFALPPLFEFSEPSLLAPLKAQVGLIHDRYKPKHPADRWLPRTQPPLRSSGLGGNSSPLASTLVTLDAPQLA